VKLLQDFKGDNSWVAGAIRAWPFWFITAAGTVNTISMAVTIHAIGVTVAVDLFNVRIAIDTIRMTIYGLYTAV
jgi:hypothetical protein